MRLYNIHLQSLGILPSVDFLQSSGTERIKKKISSGFVQQEDQIAEVLKHKNSSPYPVVLAGDFNNTSFSYIYRKLKKDMNDAFLEKGNGVGRTFSFVSYPMRIDYILTDPKFEVVKFHTLDETFSDHYPICTQLGW